MAALHIFRLCGLAILITLLSNSLKSARADIINSPPEVQTALQNLTDQESHISLQYVAMTHYFASQAMYGFTMLFGNLAGQHYKAVESIGIYQTTRGNNVSFPSGVKTSWTNGLEALKDALELESKLYQLVTSAETMADTLKDALTMEFLSDNTLKEQACLVRKISDYIMSRNRLDATGGGEYFFDRQLKEDEKKLTAATSSEEISNGKNEDQKNDDKNDEESQNDF